MMHAPSSPAGLHWPALLCAILVMVLVTIYPPVLANGQGQADHTLAMFWMSAMASGFVRGVGFIPEQPVWRALFSGWACALWCTLALAWMWLP